MIAQSPTYQCFVIFLFELTQLNNKQEYLSIFLP